MLWTNPDPGTVAFGDAIIITLISGALIVFFLWRDARSSAACRLRHACVPDGVEYRRQRALRSAAHFSARSSEQGWRRSSRSRPIEPVLLRPPESMTASEQAALLP
jgi:hypothetical protein